VPLGIWRVHGGRRCLFDQARGEQEHSSYSNDFSGVDSADPIDKYTLKITLKRPKAGFLGYVANIIGGNMVCKKAAEEMGDGFSKKPIGTGPFMFAEYQPQQFVRLVANKQYFRGSPKLDEIIAISPRIRAAISRSNRASST
jgi:peptide/nickel transport system substrate-binding protein